MKRLFVRLTVSLLTFFIGASSVKAPFIFKHLNTLKHARQAAPVPTQIVLTPSVPSSDSIKKIADVPVDDKHDSFTVQFVNEQEGWLSSAERFWRTRDAGKHWELIYDAGLGEYDIPNDIFRFQFINSKLGWFLSIKNVKSVTSGGSYFEIRMYQTEDGGTTWRRIAQSVADEFVSFQFLKDGKRGWAAGTIYRAIPKNETHDIVPRYMSADGEHAKYGAIYYTEDGGESWQRQSIPPRPNSLSGISIFDEAHVWAYGDAGIFYLDKGKWKEINYSLTACGNQKVNIKRLEIEGRNPYIGAHDINFVNAKLGWLTHSEGYIARSTDGGANMVRSI